MLNPLPRQLGGGPTNTSKAYALIRKAVGEGGSAQNDRGIEGLWRRSKAHGLAACTSAVRRVVLQMDPALATDFLPYYERVLFLVPGARDAPSTRAQVAHDRWTAQIDAVIPTIADELARIDARLSLPALAHANDATTQYGRAFDSYATSLEGPLMGPPGYARFPNYSTNFVLHVRFAVGHTGALTAEELRIVERVKAFMLDVLPSWVDYRIGVGDWHLGSTPIGFGELG